MIVFYAVGLVPEVQELFTEYPTVHKTLGWAYSSQSAYCLAEKEGKQMANNQVISIVQSAAKESDR